MFAYLKKNSLQSVGDWNYRLRFIERQMDGTARCYIALRLCTEPC